MDLDLAWLAGLYEGEGTTTASVYNNRPGENAREIRFSIAQSGDDKEVLTRAKIILTKNGIPNDRVNIHANGARTAHWVLNIHSYEWVERACYLILPMLSTRRRKQICEAFLIYCDDFTPKNKNHSKYKEVWSDLCDLF